MEYTEIDHRADQLAFQERAYFLYSSFIIIILCNCRIKYMFWNYVHYPYLINKYPIPPPITRAAIIRTTARNPNTAPSVLIPITSPVHIAGFRGLQYLVNRHECRYILALDLFQKILRSPIAHKFFHVVYRLI